MSRRLFGADILGRCFFLACCVSSSMLAIAQPPPSDLIFASDFDTHQPPIADTGLNQNATVGIALVLDGSASTDPDGDALSFQWSLTSSPIDSSAQLFDADTSSPVLIADEAGTYVLELVVSDGEFLSAPSSIDILASGTLSSTASIGPSGGAVGLPDGASVLIPPAALSSTTSISISAGPPATGSILPPTAVLVGDVYELTPAGQSFAKAVQITVPYNTALLPTGYDEGSISVYRQEGGLEFNMVGSDTGDPEPEGPAQNQDAANQRVAIRSVSFSAYAALGVRSSTQFTPVRLTVPTANVVVQRPPALRAQIPQFQECRPNANQVNMVNRTAGNIGAIVLHSTNNGQSHRTFDGELGWAANNCNKYFAHYYVNRDGLIYQVADDLKIAFHTGVTPASPLDIENIDAIGIEIFNNVGEPYDGRQLSAVIRLVDFLSEKYAIDRPLRNVTTGTFARNRTSILTGGDRVVAHSDVNTGKCDPSGTFNDSGLIKTEAVQFALACKQAPSIPIPGGSSLAPALMDLVLDSISVLGRDRQHTGIVNTHGGDSFQTGNAGNAGSVSFIEDAATVATEVGSAEQTQAADNLPLIVAPGASFALTGPGMHVYTDAIIAGTLTINGPIELRLTGTLYVSPVGKIIARDGVNGASVSVYSRGIPLIQGILDARGEDGVAGTPDGGNGGAVSFTYAAPGVLLAPTVYARGGDSDTADVSMAGGGPTGGNGGNVTMTVDDTHLVLGGGIGVVGGNATTPPWRSGTIDAVLLVASNRWMGDYLPPAPPTTMSSFVGTPAVGERKPLRPSANQVGFSRGFLTTGGMGGVGLAASSASQHGGPAGQGGDIQIALGSNSVLTMRSIDLTTGADIETTTYRYRLPGTPSELLVCTASGAQGGFGTNFGTRGGDGGTGGAAGAITVSGGTVYPLPTVFVNRAPLEGFPAGQSLTTADNNCSRGSINVGSVVEARDSVGTPLYRMRLDTTGSSLLGGLGGIPSGRTSAGNPGFVGPYGVSGSLTGLPSQ